MKLSWVTCAFLVLVAVVTRVFAQQSEGDREFFESTKVMAEKGDVYAQHDLGAMFFRGIGTAKDAVEAAKWHLKAAKQGLATSQFELGAMYANGCGVPEDSSEAVAWYRKAAEKGCAPAQSNLGGCYLDGNGVGKDEIEGVKWYRKAAEHGFASAQFNLGVCYAEGTGLARDETEAVKWYRKAADQGFADAQCNLGACYDNGTGVAKDSAEAVSWFRKAAEQGGKNAQFNLGNSYLRGVGVAKDAGQAVKWYRRAAEQHFAMAQFNLGTCYYTGEGVAKDYVESVAWIRKAADQGYVRGQTLLGALYLYGEGLRKDYVEAHKWYNLASAQGSEDAKNHLLEVEHMMTTDQIAEAQRLAREFKVRKLPPQDSLSSPKSVAESSPIATGTGFFITADGFLITNEHVVRDTTQIRLVTSAGLISARIVKVDAANDLSLLKAEGRFVALPVASSRTVRSGNTVATVGFPNIGLQGFAPKLAKGEIASLSGAGDDARYFQISVPVQPGNSGGALVDERGNVAGVVSAKLSARAALAASGSLPENVNYAVKSSFLLGFLESVPEVSAKLKDPNTKDQKFEDVVKAAEKAAVLVLVY